MFLRLTLISLVVFNLSVHAMERPHTKETPRLLKEKTSVLHTEGVPSANLKNLLAGIKAKDFVKIRETVVTLVPDAIDEHGHTAIAIAAQMADAAPAVPVLLWAGSNELISVEGKPLKDFLSDHVSIKNMFKNVADAKQQLFTAIADGNIKAFAGGIRDLAKSLSDTAYLITFEMEQARVRAKEREALRKVLLKLPLKLRDENGNNMLHRAVTTNRLPIIKAIYEVYPELAALPNNEGKTPVQIATKDIERYLQNTPISGPTAEAERVVKLLGKKGACAII